MRIDAFNKVGELYKVGSVKHTTKTKNSSFCNDILDISQTAKDYQTAKQAVAHTPDIREDKINDIKNRIAAGTYNITDEDIVGKLMEQAENLF